MAKKEVKPAGRRLGRGLGSLIGKPVSVDTKDVTRKAPSLKEKKSAAEASEPVTDAGLVWLKVDSIVPNARQPRQHFNDKSLGELATSIKTSGLMQPIVVRPAGSSFELIAGERRWRAVQLNGDAVIPAIVHDIDDKASAEWALIENLQREDLGPLERAEGISRLIREFSLTQAEAGVQLSMDRATIANLLRLLELDAPTREAIEKGLITQGHARALLGCTDLDARSALLGKCVREGWSVRETERQVKRGQASTSTAPVPRSSHVQDLEERLEKHLGTKVKITLGRKKGTGRMSVDFYSLDQFDGLLEKLGFEQS